MGYFFPQQLPVLLVVRKNTTWAEEVGGLKMWFEPLWALGGGGEGVNPSTSTACKTSLPLACKFPNEGKIHRGSMKQYGLLLDCTAHTPLSIVLAVDTVPSWGKSSLTIYLLFSGYSYLQFKDSLKQNKLPASPGECEFKCTLCFEFFRRRP